MRLALPEPPHPQIQVLDGVAPRRVRSLARIAIAWVLSDRRVPSALVGARPVAQLDNSLDVLKTLDFTVESGINLWKALSSQWHPSIRGFFT